MKQLFIVHTQYNLLLAAGLALTGRQDDILVFTDFNLTEDIRNKTKEKFDRTLFLSGAYPKREVNAKEKLGEIDRNNRKIKEFCTVKYDRVYVVEDICIQEMYALKCTYSKNKRIEMVWLEDGSNAYFSNSVISKGMGSTPLKRVIRKVFFSVRYGLGTFYDLGKCMGAHKKLTAAYLLYPKIVRPELTGKEIREITQEQFEKGMNILFKGDPYKFEENSILIAMDKLSVYDDLLPVVNEAIKGIVDKAVNEGQKVYCKYHPRETDKLPALACVEEVDSKIALEYYLTNSTTKKVTIIGVKSTVLQNAKKLGFEAKSLIAVVEGKESPVVNFYNRIGVEVI